VTVAMGINYECVPKDGSESSLKQAIVKPAFSAYAKGLIPRLRRRMAELTLPLR